MKRFFLLFVIISVLIAFMGCSQAQKPIKWEYKIAEVPDTNFTEDMGKLGDEGWELVFARRASSENGEFSYEMIFKRPKIEIDKK